MAAIYALTICLVLYAIGDIVSVKTKGLLSLVFVLCVVMLIGFWCGLPTDMVNLGVMNYDVHTPRERMEIDSVKPLYEMLRQILMTVE